MKRKGREVGVGVERSFLGVGLFVLTLRFGWEVGVLRKIGNESGSGERWMVEGIQINL